MQITSKKKTYQVSPWKIDYLKIELWGETREIINTLRTELGLLPRAELVTREDSVNQKRFYYYKNHGVSFAMVDTLVHEIEFHGTFFGICEEGFRARGDFILPLFKILGDKGIAWKIRRLDLCLDVFDKKVSDLVTKTTKLSVKSRVIRFPFDETKEIESCYWNSLKSEWKILIYDKTKDSERNIKNCSPEKARSIEGYLSRQTTRIEIRLHSVLMREHYFYPLLGQRINEIVSHFFAKKKFNGELAYLTNPSRIKRPEDFKRDRVAPYSSRMKSRRQFQKGVEEAIYFNYKMFGEGFLEEIKSMVDLVEGSAIQKVQAGDNYLTSLRAKIARAEAERKASQNEAPR